MVPQCPTWPSAWSHISFYKDKVEEEGAHILLKASVKGPGIRANSAQRL